MREADRSRDKTGSSGASPAAPTAQPADKLRVQLKSLGYDDARALLEPDAGQARGGLDVQHKSADQAPSQDERSYAEQAQDALQSLAGRSGVLSFLGYGEEEEAQLAAMPEEKVAEVAATQTEVNAFDDGGGFFWEPDGNAGFVCVKTPEGQDGAMGYVVTADKDAWARLNAIYLGKVGEQEPEMPELQASAADSGETVLADIPGLDWAAEKGSSLLKGALGVVEGVSSWWKTDVSEDEAIDPEQDAETTEEPSAERPDLPAVKGIVYTIGKGRTASGTGNRTKVTAEFDAKWRKEADGGVSGTAPEGLKVTAVGDKTMRCVVRYQGNDITTYRTFAKVVTVPDQAQSISEADNKWIRMDNLIAGGGTNTSLGDESSEEGKAEAEAIRDGLPSGRAPGSSSSNWSTSSTFSLKTGKGELNMELFQRVVAMLQWAIENDMLVGDAIMTDGVRAPEVAHKMSTSYQVKAGKIPLDRLKQDKGYGVGTDADENVWYAEGDDLDAVKVKATAIYDQNAFASEGYGAGDKSRWPNTDIGSVSNHLTGQAIDCHFPWRAPGVDASTNKIDVTAWKDVYARFGLDRPAMSGTKEAWHIELAGKPIKNGVED